MKLGLFFEPGSGICLWSADAEANAKFDYPVDLEALPISDATKDHGNRLSELFDTSIDSENPGAPSPWSAIQWAKFKIQADDLFANLRIQLGPDFALQNDDCSEALLPAGTSPNPVHH